MTDEAGEAQQSEAVAKWLTEIKNAQTTDGYEKWSKTCEVIRKRYRYEQAYTVQTRKYQMLWSNIETLKPACYSKTPQAVVARRYKDADAIGRKAAEMLERAENFTLDSNDFDSRFQQVRDDYLLYGRGVARVFYEPLFQTVGDSDEEDGLDETSMIGAAPSAEEERGEAAEEGNPGEVLEFENVKIRFVQREDFVHQPARSWDEVQWVAFRAFLTRDELTERFGPEIGASIPLDAVAGRADDDEKNRDEIKGEKKQATVWEIWDKCEQRVLWIAKGHVDVLEEGPPYLKLTGFYPCPKPAYGTMTNDTLVPRPDYVFYQDQCEEIDLLTARIGNLTESLKLVGFYPAGPQGEGAPEIELAVKPGFENKMIAVKSWAVFKEGGAGGAPIVWLPVEIVGKILEGCVALRKQLIEDIYQIIGLSDIMRGASDPRETEGAQQLKAQFGGSRVRNRQKELARFARDICRMVGEIIATTFQPETLVKMTNIKLPTQQDVQMAQMQAGQQAQMQWQQAAMQAQEQGQPAPPMPPPPQVDLGPTQEQVLELLRDGVLRRFRLDIEADSTISGDESQERQDRNEFIGATTTFIKEWGPMVAQMPMLAPLAGSLLLFGVRAFRVGRQLEEIIEETMDKIEEHAKQGPPPPQPDPTELVKLEGVKVKTAAEIQKAQIAAQQAQIDGQAKAAQTQLDAEVSMRQIAMKGQADAETHRQKLLELEMQAMHAAQEHERKKELADLQMKQKKAAARESSND